MPSENVSKMIERTNEPVRVKTNKRRVNDDDKESVQERGEPVYHDLTKTRDITLKTRLNT